MRNTVVLLCLLGGCHEVWSTGPYGMRGVLVDDRGAPIGNQRVVSEDHGVVTEEDGSFNIRWKDPTTFVDIQRGGVKWRRKWLEDTDAGTVTVQLPEVAEGTLSCKTEFECVAEIRWDVGNGLIGLVDMPCKDKTAPFKIQSMPKTAPLVNCPTIMGDLPLDVRLEPGAVHIESSPRPLPYAVVGDKPSGPCRPHLLHGEIVEGIGALGLQPKKRTFAWATCDGRAGTPVMVEPQPGGRQDKEAKVDLPWSATGPNLAVYPPLAEPRTLQLIHRDEQGAVQWEMTIEPVDGQPGTYQLPPLPRGTYRLGFGAPKLLATMNPPEPEVPGEIWLFRSGGAWGRDGGLVGAMRLEEDKAEGVVDVDVASAGSSEQMMRRPR